jgi:transcriptional regulator with XRE-family HTH domain
MSTVIKAMPLRAKTSVRPGALRGARQASAVQQRGISVQRPSALTMKKVLGHAPPAAPPDDPSKLHPLAQLRAALEWSRARLANVMSCSDRALVNWEHGEPMSAIYSAKFREIQGVFDELKEIMPASEVGPWLVTDLEEFDDLSPADLIRRGETGRLWASLFHLRTGMPD